jgi:predicted CoA-binding protein
MTSQKTERVVIVGASDNPERYSHRAQLLLRQHGHEVVPVVADLSAVSGPVDTVAMYVGPAISAGLGDKLVALKPRRILFNPGTENAALQQKLSAAGIICEEACTLVLLNTAQF